MRYCLDPGEEPLALAPAGEHQGKVLVADPELGSCAAVRPATRTQGALGGEEVVCFLTSLFRCRGCMFAGEHESKQNLAELIVNTFC